MNIADIIRGTLTILIIMIVAGAIAYIGDRVGHQVGRKRLTLFGIRPRYTSTIVAVGTGMVISLVLIVVAIIFSQQVNTALFHMNQLSAQITSLQTRESELESKVNTGELVVPVGTLMVPFFANVKQGTPVEDRIKTVLSFYRQSVTFINGTAQQRGLKKFTPPPDVEKTLRDTYGDPKVTAASLQSNLLLFATADQNLYANDEAHFALSMISDIARLKKGQPIASLVIPAGKGADINLAANELRQIVSNIGRSPQLGLPSFIANNVQVAQTFPPVDQMQATLKDGKGNYVLAAFASEDVYPHTGGIPIVLVLSQAR